MRDGIRVNAANPGLVATDLNARSPFSRGARTSEQGAEVAVTVSLSTVVQDATASAGSRLAAAVDEASLVAALRAGDEGPSGIS